VWGLFIQHATDQGSSPQNAVLIHDLHSGIHGPHSPCMDANATVCSSSADDMDTNVCCASQVKDLLADVPSLAPIFSFSSAHLQVIFHPKYMALLVATVFHIFLIQNT
jgi:hypothetical protein